MDSRRPAVGALAALAILLVLAGGTALAMGAAEPERRATPAPPPPVGAPRDPPESTVAVAIGARVAVYASPDAAKPARSLPNPNENNAPLVFLVRESRGEWMKVLLPVRPNGSTGWIKASEVQLGHNTYRIVVELAAHRITVWDGANVFLSEPIGVGTSRTPTPGGLYYLKELLQPPDPNGPYGTYAYGLSGFSNELTSFAGGDGVIGLHGTNDPSSIGKDVSHGCIRMSNAAITRLAARLPLGTPVEIRP